MLSVFNPSGFEQVPLRSQTSRFRPCTARESVRPFPSGHEESSDPALEFKRLFNMIV
jgi:hypothetical protein